MKRERAKRRSREGTKSRATGTSTKSGKKSGKRVTRSTEDPDDEDYMDVDEPNAVSDINNGDDDDDDDGILDWCSYINTFDVCITTYNVLRQDLTVARAPPVRPRREDVTYSNVERARSPLVMCEWYRVIMDEVQMVGGGKIEWVSRILWSSLHWWQAS